jgi:hypothetical protein
LCGVIGLFVAPRLASLSGLSTTTEYVIAAGFVLYGLVVYMLAALHAVRGPGIGVVIANIAFTVGAVLAVLPGVSPLTTTGIVLTLGSGVYTALMADLQFMGVRRLRA